MATTTSPSTFFVLLGVVMAFAAAVGVHAGHECMHDKIKDSPGYGTNAKKIHTVNYPVKSFDKEFYKKHHAASEEHRLATLHGNKSHPAYDKQHQFTTLQSTYSNIRISVFFDQGDCSGGTTTCGHCVSAGQTVTTFQGSTVTCTADDVLTTAKKEYAMNYIMAEAATFLSSALSVVPVSGSLTVGGSTCGGSPGTAVPSSHQTDGVANTDLIVYTTFAPLSDPNSQTVAWATKCYVDGNERPVVAHVNWIPKQLTNAEKRNTVADRGDVDTGIHEILHAMGIARPFFGTKGFLKSDGTYDTTATTTVTSSALGKDRSFIISTKVVEEVRSGFSCTSATGLEIEDQGGSGTAGSHFEKRSYSYDVMSGISSTVQAYRSRFILAFLEDTGHYQADYTKAENAMIWGKARGCDFLNTKCDSTSNRATREYCFDTDQNNMYCTHDFRARGYCDVYDWTKSGVSALPSNFQYFSTSAALGSGVTLGDYCPSVAPYSNLICTDPSLQDSTDIYGSAYKTKSRCFASNIISQQYNLPSTNLARCFEASCSSSGQITVTVKGQTFPCPTDGSEGKADMTGLSGYHGEITCPKSTDFCTSFADVTTTSSSGSGSSPQTAVPSATPIPAAPGNTPTPATASPPVATSSNNNADVTEGTYSYPDPSALPASCAARSSCADLAFPSRYPECRVMARAALDCFGNNCNAELESYLKSKGVTQNCTDRTKYASWCMEGITGATDLCNLAGATQLSVVVSTAMVLLVGLLFAVV